MSLSNYTVTTTATSLSSADFASIFVRYSGSTKAAYTGLSANGVDLAELFDPSSYAFDRITYATGVSALAGPDLQNIFKGIVVFVSPLPGSPTPTPTKTPTPTPTPTPASTPTPTPTPTPSTIISNPLWVNQGLTGPDSYAPNIINKYFTDITIPTNYTAQLFNPNGYSINVTTSPDNGNGISFGAGGTVTIPANTTNGFYGSYDGTVTYQDSEIIRTLQVNYAPSNISPYYYRIHIPGSSYWSTNYYGNKYGTHDSAILGQSNTGLNTLNNPNNYSIKLKIQINEQVNVAGVIQWYVQGILVSTGNSVTIPANDYATVQWTYNGDPGHADITSQISLYGVNNFAFYLLDVNQP